MSNPWVSSSIPPRVCPGCLGRPVPTALLVLLFVVVVVDLVQSFIAPLHPVVVLVLALPAAQVVSLAGAPLLYPVL